MLIFSIQILVLCNPIFIENSYKNHLSNSNWDEDRILVYNWGKVEKNIYKKSPLFTNNNSKAFSSFSSLEKFLRPKTTYFVNEQQAVAVGHIIQLDNFKLKLIHNIFTNIDSEKRLNRTTVSSWERNYSFEELRINGGYHAIIVFCIMRVGSGGRKHPTAPMTLLWI